ncbi:tripartite tricarboxylate transporter substrate binding protein [Roseomonas terrae]|uniref:Tripartite tricarboxylate transporter substrate binding protein n=1 Tax=Neoroseomonas terrae TaxID=424799 RepID=A0ABS5EGJ5_9PROT|nr:tripartite tricarboxylate transporter substrate binding protein [Neoroseomonas terrae]MBR0650149.1 tripartite tricarboxylate transporter substrate binding protein [Neoroseomonas terrae]
MTTGRRALLSAGAAALALPVPAVAQQEWPQRPIRIVVPYAPGGGTDLVSRLLAEAMRHDLGQPVIIENRPGGNGVVGTDQVARSPADGYTQVAVTNGHLLSPYVTPSLPFDPVRDFTPVALLAAYPIVLVSRLGLPFRDLRGLIAFARANPDGVSHGTSTPLSSSIGNLFARQIGAKMTEVPYRGGGPMMTDLIAGHLDVGWASPESALSQMGSGRLRIIGVTSRERLPLLSDVPSISEADLPDFEFTGWVGLYAPAGLPAAIARRMNAALRAAVTQQEVRRRIIQMGNYDFVEDAEAFAARTHRDAERWNKAAREGLLASGG